MKKLLFFFFLSVIAKNNFAFPVGYTEEVIITKPVYQNLYISGGYVVINAPVYADLVIAGGIVQINDSVTSDILAIGGDITFNGYVGGDIRCAGAKLHILKNVKGDLVVIGGNVIVEKEAVIEGLVSLNIRSADFEGTAKNEVHINCVNFYFNGMAERGMNIRSGKLEMSGTVAGNAMLAANEIFIDSGAIFEDSVNYWNSKAAVDFASSVKKGKAVYDESLAFPYKRWYYLGTNSVTGLVWYLCAALLMIALMEYLFSASLKKAAEKVLDAPVRSLGIGILFFIGTPIAIILFFITLIGIPVALLLLLFYIIILLLANIIASVETANWLNNRFPSKMNYWQMIFISFLIFVILKSLSSITLFGSVIVITICFMTTGGVIRLFRRKRQIPVR
ncbi:MAG TPA: polymer-forming cytoskeletal protein [Puia sp.]|nr:polymer-forming cytoskeletal protein [Puia sp.]